MHTPGTSIYIPAYLQVYQREGTQWFFLTGKVFSRISHKTVRAGLQICFNYSQISCEPAPTASGLRFHKFGEKLGFYNPHAVATDLESVLERNGLTKMNVLSEMFRINGGKPGYYLADLKNQKYYYCDREWDNLKSKIKELGIGRDDPDFNFS